MYERTRELARDRLAIELELGIGIERKQRHGMRRLGLGVGNAGE